MFLKEKIKYRVTVLYLSLKGFKHTSKFKIYV